MSWRLAGSIQTLFKQINDAYPKRSRASDGTIGDAAHASRSSDHNPWWNNTVTAGDFTHDPRAGFDIGRFSDELKASRDNRIKYVICNNLIMSGDQGPSPWVWRKYSGANPHTKHCHVSVKASAVANDTRMWRLPMLSGGSPTPPATSSPTLKYGATGPVVGRLITWANANYPAYPSTPIALLNPPFFGPATTEFIKEFQRRTGLAADGIVGPQTWRKLNEFGFRG